MRWRDERARYAHVDRAHRRPERRLREHRPTVLIEMHGANAAGAWTILTDLHYDIRDVRTGATPENVAEFAVLIRQYLAVPTRESRP